MPPAVEKEIISCPLPTRPNFNEPTEKKEHAGEEIPAARERRLNQDNGILVKGTAGGNQQRYNKEPKKI